VLCIQYFVSEHQGFVPMLSKRVVRALIGTVRARLSYYELKNNQVLKEFL
jgi:hypothetical protein